MSERTLEGPVVFWKKHRQGLQAALRLAGLEEAEEINRE